jgi:tol-pal system protein YbgF
LIFQLEWGTLSFGQFESVYDFDSRYQSALEKFDEGRYSEALKDLKQLLEQNPGNSLSDNCQYWIGECYYALGDFWQAICEFEKVFTFAKSNKYEDAQLKLGLCYLRLKDRESARRELTRLLARFPQSKYADLGRKLLKELQ